MHWKKYVTQTHIEFKRESKETIIFHYEQVEAGQLAGNSIFLYQSTFVVC